MITAPQSARPPRSSALLGALAVVLIWGSSFVLVKMVLADVGPLTVAVIRYMTAFLILLPFALRRNQQRLSRALWLRLALIGLCSYTIGNGALFWGMRYLPATTSSFLMGFIPLLVLAFGILLLREYPTSRFTHGCQIRDSTNRTPSVPLGGTSAIRILPHDHLRERQTHVYRSWDRPHNSNPIQTKL